MYETARIKNLTTGVEYGINKGGHAMKNNGAYIFHELGAWFIAPLCCAIKVGNTVCSGPARLDHGSRFTVGGTDYEFSL